MERRLRLQLEQQTQIPHSSASDIWTPMTSVPIGKTTPSPSSDGKRIQTYYHQLMNLITKLLIVGKKSMPLGLNSNKFIFARRQYGSFLTLGSFTVILHLFI